MKSFNEEYNLGKDTIRYWLKNIRKECDEQTHDYENGRIK